MPTGGTGAPNATAYKAMKKKLEAAEREAKELRERLGLNTPYTLESWESSTPQEMRDEFAARALFAEWGNPERAMRRLGFDIASNDPRRAGVQAVLSRDMRDAAASREEITRRMRQIALHSSDDAAVRAVAQLSRIDGWVQDGVVQPAPVVNLYQLFGDKFGEGGALTTQRPEIDVTDSTDPLELLNHEPAAAGTRIDSGDDAVKAALSGAEE
jgi:hypothetical protein